jgi:hypothetical protein
MCAVLYVYTRPHDETRRKDVVKNTEEKAVDMELVQLRKDILDIAVGCTLELHSRPTLNDIDKLTRAFETYVLTGSFPERAKDTGMVSLVTLSQYTKDNLDRAKQRISTRKINGSAVSIKEIGKKGGSNE